MLPIKDLGNYLKSVRENGQNIDDIPVVDMGQIVDTKINWFRPFAYATSLGLFLIIGSLAYTKNYTIILKADSDVQTVSDIVSDYGGTVYSVKQEDDSYKVRLFTFRNINNFVKRLSENKQFKKVELSK